MEGGHNMAYLYQLNIVINSAEENLEIEKILQKLSSLFFNII